MHSNL